MEILFIINLNHYNSPCGGFRGRTGRYYLVFFSLSPTSILTFTAITALPANCTWSGSTSFTRTVALWVISSRFTGSVWIERKSSFLSCGANTFTRGGSAVAPSNFNCGGRLFSRRIFTGNSISARLYALSFIPRGSTWVTSAPGSSIEIRMASAVVQRPQVQRNDHGVRLTRKFPLRAGQ